LKFGEFKFGKLKGHRTGYY